MPNNKSYIIIFLISIIFSQNIWTGNSVSTSDNLDAFSLNPAGFGLDRGEQAGFYFPVNNDRFEFVQAQRSANFGYLLKYSDARPLKLRHQPISFKIGLGFETGKGNYLGLLWEQVKNGEGTLMEANNNFTFGAIIRPW